MTTKMKLLSGFAPLLTLLLGAINPIPACADLVAEYRFNNAGTVVPDSEPTPPNHNLSVQPNGTSFASANTNGVSPPGSLLGFAGQMSEPVEPTNEDNNYGFWINKSILSTQSEWSVSLWFNRNDIDNHDFLFYVGTGDGFGGTGAETYVYGAASGALVAENRSSNSNVDMFIQGGTTDAGIWHQAGMVRNGSTFSLFLDGELLGTDTSVSLNSFNSSANSVIVFGAAKWMRLANMRTRVHDGLIDQIEIYDHALEPEEIQARYQQFVSTIPEPSSGIFVALGLLCMVWNRRKSRSVEIPGRQLTMPARATAASSVHSQLYWRRQCHADGL